MKKIVRYTAILSVLLPLAGQSCRTAPNTPSAGATDTTNNGGGNDTLGNVQTSAIDGLVLKGPISPIERPGIANVAPLAGAIISISQDNTARKPTDVISDANGKFYLKVSPGTYTLTPNPFPNNPLPRPQGSVTIVVTAKIAVSDTLHYDTGIR